jgi:hypothetical protein
MQSSTSDSDSASWLRSQGPAFQASVAADMSRAHAPVPPAGSQRVSWRMQHNCQSQGFNNQWPPGWRMVLVALLLLYFETCSADYSAAFCVLACDRYTDELGVQAKVWSRPFLRQFLMSVSKDFEVWHYCIAAHRKCQGCDLFTDSSVCTQTRSNPHVGSYA